MSIHKLTLYRYVLPYCIRALDEPYTWILLNREYKPLNSFDSKTYVDYNTHPSKFRIQEEYTALKAYFLGAELTQNDPLVPQFHLYEEDTDPFVPYLTRRKSMLSSYPDFIHTARWKIYTQKLTAIMRLNILG